MASDEVTRAAIEAVLAHLAEQGVKSADDTPSEPLPPIMVDPARVFRHAAADRGETFKLSGILARARPQAPEQDTAQITQDGPVDSPRPKDAAE